MSFSVWYDGIEVEGGMQRNECYSQPASQPMEALYLLTVQEDMTHL